MGLGSTQNMKTKQTPTQQVRKLSYLAGSEFVYRDSSMFFCDFLNAKLLQLYIITYLSLFIELL